MAHYFSGRRVGNKLIAAGVCPPDAFNVEIRLGIDGVMDLHFDCHASDDQVRKIVGVLVELIAETDAETAGRAAQPSHTEERDTP